MWVAFAGLGWALVGQRAGRTHFSREGRDEGFLLAVGTGWFSLPIWEGNFHGVVALIELDCEVDQVQLLRIGGAPADGGLNMFNLLFLQDRIGHWATMPNIGVDRLQSSLLLQIGKRFRFTVGCHRWH